MMNEITLLNEQNQEIQAHILFTYYNKIFNKNYIIYMVDNDVLASSFEIINNQYILNNNLTSEEYDMIDKEIERKKENDSTN